MTRRTTNAPKTGKDRSEGGKRVKTPNRKPRPLAPRPAPITWASARCEATGSGWHLVLPTPERTNAIWRQWKGRTLVSAKHRADKATAAARFRGLTPMRGDVAVRMVWVRERRAGDVDSRLKAGLDLLTVIGLWTDDAQCSDVQVTRVDNPTKAPGLYVWAWPAGQPERDAA